MAIELEEGPIAGDCEDRRGDSNDRGKKPMQARPDLASIPEHPRIARDHASNGETSKDSDFQGKGVVNNGRQDNDNRREVPRAWEKPKHVPLILNEEKTNFVKEDGLVTLNLEEARNNVSKLDKAIVGRLLGRRLPFWVVQNEIQRKWGHLGLIQVTPMGVDCFLCWFSSVEARNSVLIGGPWFVAGHIIGLDKWKPSIASKSLEGFTSPVWIRLPNLPLEYWDSQNLARLAASVGEPMLMDEQTSSWGRCSYARVCVRIDLARKLPKGIWAHGLNGRFFQPIEYEGIPIICSKCGRIGHKIEECKEQLIQKSKEGQVGKENREQKEGELRNLDVEKLNSMKVMDCGGGPIMNGQTVQEADDEEGSWTIVARRRNRNVRKGMGAEIRLTNQLCGEKRLGRSRINNQWKSREQMR